MFLIHLNWNLEYSCTSTKHTPFHRCFQIIFIKHSQVHNYPIRNAHDYSICKANNNFLGSSNKKNRAYFMEFFGYKFRYYKTAKHFRD